MERRYLDSSVFVTYWLKNREPGILARCAEQLDRVARREVEGVTSWLTWDEMTWCAGRAHGRPFDHAAAQQAGSTLRALTNLRFIDAGAAEIAEAERLLGAHGVRPRDSIHAATALLHAGGVLVTLDSDFRSRPEAGLTLIEIA